jgi:hypothetical protein
MSRSREGAQPDEAEQRMARTYGGGAGKAGTPGDGGANGEVSITEMKKVLEEIQKTMEEVKMLLQHRKGLRRLWPFS